ncbi:hypothetical protein ACLOJK_011645 [Asimina triloba]
MGQGKAEKNGENAKKVKAFICPPFISLLPVNISSQSAKRRKERKKGKNKKKGVRKKHRRIGLPKAEESSANPNTQFLSPILPPTRVMGLAVAVPKRPPSHLLLPADDNR